MQRATRVNPDDANASNDDVMNYSSHRKLKRPNQKNQNALIINAL